MKNILIVFAAASLSGCAFLSSKGAAPAGKAELQDAQGGHVGTAMFYQNPDMSVSIAVEVSGLSPGTHGIHIHAVGSCTAPAFTDAGGHFNPSEMKHGLENAAGPHNGDLENLVVGADGTGKYKSSTTRVFAATGGTHSLFDADGSAVVIHAAADDQKTDPSGNSGARIACGVVRPSR